MTRSEANRKAEQKIGHVQRVGFKQYSFKGSPRASWPSREMAIQARAQVVKQTADKLRNE